MPNFQSTFETRKRSFISTFSICMTVPSNTKWKDCKCRKNLCTKSFTYTKNIYAHKIAAVDLSKIHLLKNARKTCKPNNRDLDGDLIKCINYDMIYKSNSWSQNFHKTCIKLVYNPKDCDVTQIWIYELKKNKYTTVSC